MATFNKGARYLRVTHTGQTSGPLYLSDLDDEENAQEEKKIQVYIPENESADLPFDEDVLLSYQQGTIRGLEDQGFLSTTVIDDQGNSPEIWVSPNGDDSNPGTRNAPYASIQKAVDDLAEEYGSRTLKTVHLMVDEVPDGDRWDLSETVVINTSRFRLVGTSDQVLNFFETSSNVPIFVITDLTKQGYEDFVSDGGLAWTANTSTGDYTYTGQDPDNYENAGEDVGEIILENISFWDADTSNPCIALLGSKDGSRGNVRKVDIINSRCVTLAPGLFAKNAESVRFYGYACESGQTIFDETINISSNGDVVRNFTLPTYWGDVFIQVPNGSFDVLKPSPGSDYFKSLFVSGSGSDFFHLVPLPELKITDDIIVGDDNELGTTSNPCKIHATRDSGATEMKDSSQLHAIDSQFYDLQKTSSGALTLRESVVFNNVTIEAGSNTTLTNCTIEGDLQVDAPASATLENVVVLGNLEGDGDIDFTGGGWKGSNNNTGTVTHTALNTTP